MSSKKWTYYIHYPISLILMYPDWSAIMQTALQKKFGATRALSYKDQAKRARFLEYRGFPASLISQFVFD